MKKKGEHRTATATEFVRAIANAIARQVASVLPPGTPPRVLVALSGGPDSTALLLALHQAIPEALIGAAHFHHGLRGADADADAAFCAGICARLGTICTIGLGKVIANGRSPQDAARRDRYAFLIETATDLGANLIAIAHNADDQAETVLARVLRGTSVDGLAGIAATRQLAPNLFICRPLLGCSRAEIEAFCAAQEITPRQDPTNFGTKYVRSRLRQRMPEIARDFNPRLGDALRRLAANAAIDSDLLTVLAEEQWKKTVREMHPGRLVSLDREVLATVHPALRRRVLLRAIVAVYAHTSDTTASEEAATSAFVRELERIALTGSGAVSLPGGQIRASISETQLMLTREILPDPFSPYSAPLSVPGVASAAEIGLTVTASIQPASELITTSPLVVRFNATAVSTAGLLLRSPRPGDRIAPFGMGGKSKSVRDVLADIKLPIAARDLVPLIVRADEPQTVLWIVGRMQSELTRVTEATQEVIVLTANWDT